MLDYIEWIVPSLSNQTYEIILITKAQHLDSNKNFISDIYNEVKSLDGNWSEQINDSEYVRVTFEKNLTNVNDITIYPRTVSGTPRIEVYEVNKSELIAEFTNIIDNEYNKVYLINLNGSQNTFDLKIVGGSVEFDYIVDPYSGPINGIWMNLSGNDTDDWVGTSGVFSLEINTNNNLIYTGGAGGKFGVYNHSNGVWMDLSGNDTYPGTTDWAGANDIYGIAVNPNDNLIYTGLTGKFGVYNHSNGVWMDLSGNISGFGGSVVRSLSVNTNDNLVYTGIDNGKFGVYNHSNGVWMDLSANDTYPGTTNWAGTSHVYGIAVNTDNNLIYTGLNNGKFGVYNHSLSQDFGTAPRISIAVPSNNSFTNNNLQDINFTASDTNLNTCWYGNDTYTANTTLANCNTNITTLIWSEGQHNVTVYANDSLNNV